MTRTPFHHVRRGSGPPLVLIHGIGHHHQGWDPVARLLDDTFEVIAVDTPGFGRSEPLPGPYDIGAYVDAFVAWLGEQGIKRPHVAGNSMGGGIALELARRGAVRSVCAISPVGFWADSERGFAQIFLGILNGMPAALRPLVVSLGRTAAGRAVLGSVVFARPWRMPGDEFASLLTDLWASPVFAATLEAFDAYDFDRAEELDGTPVTIAWGSRDRLLLYGPQSQRARERLPNARHVTLPGLGHTPFFDDPGMVASVIRAAAS
ncbi:MAG TPA: alpha/beta hydrolase [Solirubrobacteraceae bacterium]